MWPLRLTLLTCSTLAPLAHLQSSNMPGSLLPLSLAHVIHHAIKVGIPPSRESGLIRRLALAKGKLEKIVQAEVVKHLCAGFCPLAALGNPEITV